MRCLSSLSLAVLAFVYGAAAQTATVSAPAVLYGTAAKSSTASAPASTHTVIVGYDTHQFSPKEVTANPGDLIVFQFIAKGHTVVQSYFKEPCVPRNTYHPGLSTFFSGWFNGSDVGSDHPPTWNLTVNDTTPIFFYCSLPGSCLDNHMIGSINQNATFSFQAQLDSINNQTGIMLQPGEEVPDESTSSSSPDSTSSHHGITLSSGAIAGIVVAGVVVLALACALFWFVGRHRTLKASLNTSSQQSGTVEQWVNSTNPPSTIGPTSARPPSYGGEMGYMVPMDAAHNKHWDYGHQQNRHSYMPMTPPIQELGVSEPVEMEETGRGRSRNRQHENESQILDSKMVGSHSTQVFEKE